MKTHSPGAKQHIEDGERRTSGDLYGINWFIELFDKKIFDYLKSEVSKNKYVSVCLRRVSRYQRGNQSP